MNEQAKYPRSDRCGQECEMTPPSELIDLSGVAEMNDKMFDWCQEFLEKLNDGTSKGGVA